jgi:endonuclease/exonuclease/phosphatase family metal-dependent hydrolase
MAPELPRPLTVVQRDFRAPGEPAARRDHTMRIVQWNVERCYKLEGIIEELRRLEADVLALQEVDWGCERSGFADGCQEIGRALGVTCAFVAEFAELHSPLRSRSTQGGGLHGQALLSRYDLVDVRALVHSHQPVDWEEEGAARAEPRKGKRVALVATVKLPAPLGPVLVYSVHLEVFTGITGRLRQFADVLQDCRVPGRPARQVICGDLNTMAHSVARLSPLYCCDRFRWLSIGWSEARFWAHSVFAVTDSAEGTAAVLEAAEAARGRWHRSSRPLVLAPGAANSRLAAYRLPAALCAQLVNPGFVDAWCPDADVTLNNPKYLGLMQGKLDWVLARRLRVVDKQLGNHDYALSDHKWLCVDVACDG